MERLKNENVMQVNISEKQEKERKPWKGILQAVLILIAILALQTGITVICSAIYSAICIAQAGGDIQTGTQIYMDKVTDSGLVTDILAITTAIYGLIAVLWYKFGFVKKYTSDQLNEFRQQVLHGKIIAAFAFAAVGCYCVAILLSKLIAFAIPGSMETYNSLMETALGGSAVISSLVVVIFAPVAEEAAFRGIIFRTLIRNNCSPVVAIIIQAAMFSIFHLNIMQSLYVIPLGLLLGYTAYKCKSVLPCIFIHMVYNFMPMILALLPESTPVEIAVTVVLVICGGAVYILGKSINRQTA